MKRLWSRKSKALIVGGIGSAGLFGTILASTIYAKNKVQNKNEELKVNDEEKNYLSKIQTKEAFTNYSLPEDCRYKILKLEESIEKARDLCNRVKDEFGIPGLTVGLSVNGKLVWKEGFGYMDIENRVKMNADAIFRIASISKPMTMAMLGKLMDQDKVDLDCPIQNYVTTFPKKHVDGKEVTITTRHLLSHLSGIRHYKTKEQLDEEKKRKAKGEKKKVEESEMSLKEYYLKNNFDSIEKSLELFSKDQLIYEPGTKFLYSTHAWTLVASIIEKLTETKFEKYAKKMFTYWGLKNTYLDENDPIIYNRTRYYSKNDNGKVVNSPYVDNSYKWAGGGFLSNVSDLMQFAHIMLYSFQCPPHSSNNNWLSKEPFLSKKTIKNLWTGHPNADYNADMNFYYGMGFVVGEPFRKCMYGSERELITVFHTGGAIGSTSILSLTFPKNFQITLQGCDEIDNQSETKLELCRNVNNPDGEVNGIVVAMICNLTEAGLSRTAFEISNLFKWLLE